ncbi:MAG: PIG-L family deacetylase [Dermatophilaceae bacterium]
MAHTLLAFHAHPDDEALLTAGTMARAAAEGNRVIVVVATDGNEGLASSQFAADGLLGARRLDELRASARALGVARVEHLGYADSGLGPETLPDPGGRTRFIRADVDEAARLLADILVEESVDVLLTYDANGGYGHRDHVKVHAVGERAAQLAKTARVLQATVPRDTICRGVAFARKVYRFPTEFDPTTFQRSFSPRADITHRVNVTRYAGAKRASMRAHASQASADGGTDRTLAAFLRIPRPLFDLVFGREWFVDPAHPPGAPVSRDIFGGLP